MDLFRNKVEIQWSLVTYGSINNNIFNDQFAP